jgi:hypothetical protein
MEVNFHMATTAALGKASATPAISAALFQQVHFFVRKSAFSWAPKFYFYDQTGKTLAFVRNATLTWNREIRVFTDPGMSFELLAIRPVAGGSSRSCFEITDSVNHHRVGTIRHVETSRLQRRQWALMGPAGQEVGTVIEDSLLLGGLRRLVTELLPQGYTFRVAECVVGTATQKGSLFNSEMEIDLSADHEKQLDPRLVTAVLVLLLASSAQSPE